MLKFFRLYENVTEIYEEENTDDEKCDEHSFIAYRMYRRL